MLKDSVNINPPIISFSHHLVQVDSWEGNKVGLILTGILQFFLYAPVLFLLVEGVRRGFKGYPKPLSILLSSYTVLGICPIGTIFSEEISVLIALALIPASWVLTVLCLVFYKQDKTLQQIDPEPPSPPSLEESKG